MLNGCSIKAFEGWLSDLVRKNYHFDCIFDCWRVTIVEKHIRQLPLVTDFLVYSLLVFGLVISCLAVLAFFFCLKPITSASTVIRIYSNHSYIRILN